MWDRIKQWWAAEGALVGLQGVSDRMLADMGLQREDLRERVLAPGPKDRQTVAAPGSATQARRC